MYMIDGGFYRMKHGMDICVFSGYLPFTSFFQTLCFLRCSSTTSFPGSPSLDPLDFHRQQIFQIKP